MNILFLVIFVVFGIVVIFVLICIVCGLLIFDCVVVFDVLFIEVMCVFGVEMVINGYICNILVLFIIVVVGVFGLIGVVCFVVRRDNMIL